MARLVLDRTLKRYIHNICLSKCSARTRLCHLPSAGCVDFRGPDGGGGFSERLSRRRNAHTVETEPLVVDWRRPMTSSIDLKTTGELRHAFLHSPAIHHPGGCSRDGVPLLRHRPHQSCAMGGNHAAKNHGNSLGRGRNKKRTLFSRIPLMLDALRRHRHEFV